MSVRPYLAKPHMKVAPAVNPVSFVSLAAIKGVSSAQIVGGEAAGYARAIENGYITQTGVKPRGGKRRQATTGTKAVHSLITYESGTTKKLFAGSNGKIFDVTSPASPTVAPTPSVTGLANNAIQHTNFANASGSYVVAVNGSDLHYIYNGTAWVQNSPAITGVSSALFSNVAVYGSRLWFVQKDSLSAWFLPVDSIGGAAIELPLRNHFDRGGSLLYIATWSLSGGAGLSQAIVFVTTNGQVAAFQGYDPTNASAWVKIGVYDIGAALGANGHVNVGGELELMTTSGIVPITQAINKDPATLSLAAITREINPEWKSYVALYRNKPWYMVKWPEKNLLYVAASSDYTTSAGVDTVYGIPRLYVANMETGAWTNYTGWDFQSVCYFNGKVYFGSSNGNVYEAENSGSDDGSYYVFRYMEWPSDFGAPSSTKTFSMIRTTYNYSVPFNAVATILTNFNTSWPSIPNVAANASGSGSWDTGSTWDTGGTWDQISLPKTDVRWHSIGATGYKGSIVIQMTFSNTLAPDVEIAQNEVTFFKGSIIT